MRARKALSQDQGLSLPVELRGLRADTSGVRARDIHAFGRW